MGSSSSKSPGKGGDEWSGKVYFDPEADKSSGDSYWISDDELREKLKELIDPSEEIMSVAVYKTPLSESQWSNVYLNHQYTLLETGDWWWSIEKNSEGITVQRSKKHEAVLRRYRQKMRLQSTSYWNVQLIVQDSSKKTMGELVNWLWRKDQLNMTYHWWSDNCQHFASRLFNELAKSKSHHP